jgi:hypothetical protein
MDLSNPQSLNRYAYVFNNPVNLMDPTGLDVTGGPYAASGCTLFDGTEGEVFACAGGSGEQVGGFSFGLFGLGFGGLGGGFGIPLPGCILPGACNVQLPTLTQEINNWLAHLPWNDPCIMSPVSDLCGFTNGFAANNGFTLGIRAPGQSWSNCMSANANTYSVGGATEVAVNVATGTSSNISEKTSIVTGNGITGLIFEGPGSGDFLSAASAGAGSPLTYGRRTSSIMSLNLAGKGGLPNALGSTGVKGFFQTAGKWLNFGLDEAEKFAVDAGLAGAESINCAIPRGW